MEGLANFATDSLGAIDIWINNAGTNGYVLANLVDQPPETIREVVETNIVGTLNGSRAALKVMIKQGFGHMFNMVGAGVGGDATPLYSVYGATKRCLPQLNASLVKETKGTGVGVHLLQPGMVLTDLLLSSSSVVARRFFNVLAETPQNVATELVPQIRSVQGTGSYIKFLTVPRVLFRFLTFWARSKRFFDEQGNPIGSWFTETNRYRN
mmetsp:Transcript_8326/g.14044  ORF Transcript_8326/g.14044 Transcript_8326/m.14044 type:complete len:210 (+) Transcript_8326:398-1027(+)